MLRVEKPAFFQEIQNGVLSLPRKFELPSEMRLLIGVGRAYMISTLAVLGGGTGLEVCQTFAENTPKVEAADQQCRVGVRIEAYRYFDMAQIVPELGRRYILDMGIDPRAGSTAGFLVEAVPSSYKSGDREKAGFKPLGSTNIIRDQKADVGRGEMQFTASCNTTAVTSDGKRTPALEYKLISNLDPLNDQFVVVTPDGRRSVVSFGSEVKQVADFQKIIDSGVQEIKDLDSRKKELIVKAVQSLTLTPTPTPIHTSVSARATFTFTPTAAAREATTTARATATQTPTPTVKETATPTVMATVTPSPTGTVVPNGLTRVGEAKVGDLAIPVGVGLGSLGLLFVGFRGVRWVWKKVHP